MYIICRTRIPSYSDLLQCNEREGVCPTKETKVKKVSGRNEREREGEGKENETCSIKDKREDQNCVIEQQMYAFKLCSFSINTSVLFYNENNILFF